MSEPVKNIASHSARHTCEIETNNKQTSSLLLTLIHRHYYDQDRTFLSSDHQRNVTDNETRDVNPFTPSAM